jgi:hypothetical protein
MLAVCEAQFARLEAELSAALAASDDPMERLALMGERYIRFGVEHPEQYRILLMTKGGHTREDFESGRTPGVSAFRLLLGAVEAAMDAGVFRRDDPFLVATGLWAVVHGVTSLRIAMPTFPVDGEQLFAHLLAVHARGLAEDGVRPRAAPRARSTRSRR